MIDVRHITKIYNGNRPAVEGISFHVEKGATLGIIGSSGSGKTTLLKMMNRLITPTSGEIRINGHNIINADPIPMRRSIGYILQRGGLFPHWSVKKNIALVPELLKWPNQKVEKKVRALLELVDLDYELYAERFPNELSGGEQQRIGIARALAADPDIILLDEPFSALDPITSTQLQRAFKSLKDKVQKTMVLVTHDINEAFLLSEMILILDRGKEQQYGTPEDIRKSPANQFVKDFLKGHLHV